MRGRILLLSNFLILGLYYQGVRANGYVFELLNEQFVSIVEKKDSVLFLSDQKNIFYLNSSGYISSTPESTLKPIKESLHFTIIDGAIHVSNKAKLSQRFPGKSIRFTDSVYTASYSGLFKEEEPFTELTYSNGTIRTFGDSTFVSWDGFSIFTDSSTHDFTDIEGSLEVRINGKNYGYARDSYLLGTNIILATTTGYYAYDFQNDTVYVLLESSYENRSILSEGSDVEGKLHALYVADGFNTYKITKSRKVVLVKSFPKQILHFNPHQSIYVTESTVYDELIGFSFKIDQRFHAVFKVNDIYYGTSDFGLYGDLSNAPFPIINQEFNARSFYMNDSIIQMGSVDGLYTTTPEYLNSFIQQEKSKSPFAVISAMSKKANLLLLALVVFIPLGLLFVIYKLIKKVEKINNPSNAYTANKRIEVNRTVILDYINNNLSTVSILDLCNEFELSQQELYNYFKGTSPGKTIKQLRLERAKALWKANTSLDSIAADTGYSLKYLKQKIIPTLSAKG